MRHGFRCGGPHARSSLRWLLRWAWGIRMFLLPYLPLPPLLAALITSAYPFFLLRCVQEQSELARKVADTEDSAAHPHPTRNPHRNPRLHPHLAHNSRRLKHSSSHSMRPIACAGRRGGCDPTPTHLHLHLATPDASSSQHARPCEGWRAAPPLPTNHPPPRTQVQSLANLQVATPY